MKLDIISYADILDSTNPITQKNILFTLLNKGIIGISDVPLFETKTRAYINAARSFSALEESIKQQYAPIRETGDTDGYEQGAEQFKNKDGIWQVDDKKVSYYAHVPDKAINKWPREVDLKTSYLALGELIFETGKILLNAIGLNNSVGLQHNLLTGYGRMLHYRKESDATNTNPNWCGEHFDHDLFTGLVPAYYFRNNVEIAEPEEAGLYIKPPMSEQFEKIACPKSILLFQVGEFGQLLSNDRIRATKHVVKKAMGEIERYAFALFYSADQNLIIKSNSVLAQDSRYTQHQADDGSIHYKDWSRASFERYLKR